MHALSVRGLVKTYRNGVQALKGIDLDVERGDFFALLGPNGAGKTTLIGIVTSLAASPDLVEGIRARVIDKDRRPRWSPSTLAEVDVEATLATVDWSTRL